MFQIPVSGFKRELTQIGGAEFYPRAAERGTEREKSVRRRGRAGHEKKRPICGRFFMLKFGYAEIEASFFASFAFLFAALFLCRIPLLAAESIAETVSG